jgi:hypothetical protein
MVDAQKTSNFFWGLWVSVMQSTSVNFTTFGQSFAYHPITAGDKAWSANNTRGYSVFSLLWFLVTQVVDSFIMELSHLEVVEQPKLFPVSVKVVNGHGRVMLVSSVVPTILDLHEIALVGLVSCHVVSWHTLVALGRV